MAGSPRWKLYNEAGEYVASCKYGEDAAALVAHLGQGATILDGHRVSDIRWTEGETGDASESFDQVADAIERGSTWNRNV